MPNQFKGHLSMSNSNYQKIHAILEQRQPMVAKVTELQQGLSPLVQAIQEIQCYRDLALAENSDRNKDQWKALDTAVETYALVSFFKVGEFLEQIIAPYFVQLKLCTAPKNLQEFRQIKLPNPLDTGGETVTLINQLREYQEYLDDYQDLFDCSDKCINRDEILRHVAKHPPDTDENKKGWLCSALPIKITIITLPFLMLLHCRE